MIKNQTPKLIFSNESYFIPRIWKKPLMRYIVRLSYQITNSKQRDVEKNYYRLKSIRNTLSLVINSHKYLHFYTNFVKRSSTLRDVVLEGEGQKERGTRRQEGSVEGWRIGWRGDMITLVVAAPSETRTFPLYLPPLKHHTLKPVSRFERRVEINDRKVSSPLRRGFNHAYFYYRRPSLSIHASKI